MGRPWGYWMGIMRPQLRIRPNQSGTGRGSWTSSCQLPGFASATSAVGDAVARAARSRRRWNDVKRHATTHQASRCRARSRNTRSGCPCGRCCLANFLGLGWARRRGSDVDRRAGESSAGHRHRWVASRVSQHGGLRVSPGADPEHPRAHGRECQFAVGSSRRAGQRARSRHQHRVRCVVGQ